MMQLEKALTTVKGRIAGVTETTKLLAHSIWGKNRSWDGRGVVALNKIGATIGKRYT
jgi:hypothetical protein